MDYLINTFKRMTVQADASRNLKFLGQYDHEPPRTAYTNPVALKNHQATLLRSFEQYLTPDEINLITNEYRRSDVNMTSILTDFFAGDVENHDIPVDEHLINGLNAMEKAFRPPRPCLPCHINDVEHHYPYKWQVNSEPPFSTDRYFRNQLPTFGEFIESKGLEHIDKADFDRRHENQHSKSFLSQPVPPKFGFQKNTIFNWTRRWHHVIKDGFNPDRLAGLKPNDTYISMRYIFPMLLHTKTAIVKKDDPDKMRTIWGCSKPWIIADTMIYWEYIAWLKLHPGRSPMLWGFETFTGGWIRLNAILTCQYLTKSFVTLDWSRFDKRAYFSLIRLIMQRVRNFLDFSRGYVPNKDYPTTDGWDSQKEQRLERLWQWTLENLFNAPIVLPNGDVYQRTYAGIPSGLYITQLLDSWYNYTMIATMLSTCGMDPDLCLIKVQGDDSIIRLSVLVQPNLHEIFLRKLQESADFYFKSVISVDKSEIRQQLNGCEVLSYRNHNGFPYRDEIKMLAQFYHTKARDPTPSITMAQSIGFAYASCGNHFRVYELLRNIYSYYQDQGYSPNRAGLTAIFGNSPDLIDFPFELDHFPTIQEIQQFFMSTNYRSKTTDAKTWPLDYFLFSPCDSF